MTFQSLLMRMIHDGRSITPELLVSAKVSSPCKSHPPVVLISLSRVGQSFRVYAGCCTRLLAVVKEASKAARVYVLIFKHVEAWAL